LKATSSGVVFFIYRWILPTKHSYGVVGSSRKSCICQQSTPME